MIQISIIINFNVYFENIYLFLYYFGISCKVMKQVNAYTVS